MNVFLGGVNYVSKIILTINYNIEHNSWDVGGFS